MSLPVLQGILYVQVIEEKRFTQVDIICGLLQWEPLGEEGNQAVADGPQADMLVENSVITEHHNLDVVVVSQPRQDALHGRGQRLHTSTHRPDKSNIHV